MAEHIIRRRIVWEKSGVSEIIGTILMLSITVVLFSSIITMVGSMPAPRQTFIVDLKCSLQPVNPDDWTQGVDFRVLHQGGQVMDPLWIKIYITVDNKMLTKGVADGLSGTDVNGDSNWGVGEWWVYRITNVEVMPVTLDPNAVYTITIIDQEKNALVWHETLGESANNYGPIIKRAWIDSDLATPEVDDYGPIGFEKQFKIYAEIVDPEGFDTVNGLNKSDLWVNVSSIFNSTTSPIQLQDVLDSRDAPNDNIYVAYSNGPFKIPIGYYMFIFNATDITGHSSMFAGRFPIGQIVGEKPQIVVKGNNPETGKYEYITFSNPEPTNGDTVEITATILNLGGKGANVDVYFYMDYENPASLINTVPKTVLVPEVGQQDAKISWTASPGGVHMIIVYAEVSPATVTADFYDPDMTDNTNYTNISVMPKILLVDDDSHVNDLSEGDTVSFMRASLEAADFEYDFTIVGAGDGPGYDYGDYPLMEYDVVIWMTGYRTSKTLTVSNAPWSDRTDDVANLQRFLTGNPNGTVVDGLNGGSLWLISQGFWSEALLTPSLGTFANDFLHINPLPVLNAPLPTQLYGNASHPVTDYFADIPINTEVRVLGMDSAYYWGYNDIPDKPRIALNDSANTRVYALSYDSDDYPSDTIIDSRILAQTWDFSRTSDTATQCQYAYKAILWLGNITSKFTQDVAISEQTIDPETVFYKQQVTIRFVVRNNGLQNYTTADNLWYLLRIIDMNGIDTIVPHLQRIDFLGTKSNNTLTISIPWEPQQIGYHRISIKIDPYNYIEESNELNNEISSYWGTGELNVLYRVLVVDDDESVNNGGIRANETASVTEALDYLGYQYEFYTVNVTMDGPAYQGGANRSALSEYNAVIWVTGSAFNPLTTTAPYGGDVQNITSYMNIGGSFWLIGTGLWTAADETVDAFETNYLKIGSVDADHGMAARLRGIDNDDVSHGMDYACTSDADADILAPTGGGICFTYQNDAMTVYNSVRFKGTTSTNTTVMYRSTVTAWPLSSINEPLSRAEFVFMILRWFDKPEDRIEVRLSDVDIWITDDPNPHPQLGSGYVIQASVQNTGGYVGNVLVRFMDGSTQIGSDSISVSPGGWTTAEIIWVPLFAGPRTISVLLDPILQVPEIFPYSAMTWTNNIATRDIYVYFFWDDMESGPSKWTHRSTITLINGEGPLEYFGNTAVTVNIEDEWNYAESVGLNNCTDIGFYHTHDKSFWLQEPSGSTTIIKTRGPIDVIFALDTSGSMAQEIDELIIATKGFIGKLTDVDRAAIWTFGNDAWDYPYDQDGIPNDRDPSLLRGWTIMTSANRDSFNTSINGIGANSYTPFYDTLGEAIRCGVGNTTNTSKMYVIGMTDGESNNDEGWTPNTVWGATMTDGAYGTNKVKQGLIDCPPMVYTILMDPDNAVPHDPAYPTAPDWSRTAPNPTTYPHEYDLWHSADSTPQPTGSYGVNISTGEPFVGHYYYTTDPNQLPEIFDSIFNSIIIGQLGGEEQTRSSLPGPSTLATVWSDGFETNNFNGWDGAPTTDWTIRTGGTENDYGGSPVTVHGGTYCADARDSDGTDNILDKTVDLTGITGASLSFWWDNQDIENNDERAYLSVWDGSWHNGIWYSTINNDGDQQTNAADWAQATVDLSGYNMVNNFIIRFTAPAGMDQDEGGTGANDDEFMLDDVELTGTSPLAPWIVSTVPANGAGGVATTSTIVITFSEAMSPTTLAWTISPNPGGWTEVWSGGNTIVTLSHSAAFTQSTVYTVTVTSCQDTSATPIAPYTLIISTNFEDGTLGGWSTGGAFNWNVATDRANGVYSAKGGQNGYSWMYRDGFDLSSAVNTKLDFNIQSINTDAGADYFYLMVSITDWATQTTVLTFDGAAVVDNAASHWHHYTVDLSAYNGQPDLDISFEVGTNNANEYYWVDDIMLTSGSVPNPWTFTTVGPPIITATTPVNATVGVFLTQNVIIDFSKVMNTASLTYTCVPDPGGWAAAWSNGDKRVTLTHAMFASLTAYTFTVTQARDLSAANIVAGPVPNPWYFTTVIDDPPTITAETPANGAIMVPVNQAIVITFSEAMNTATLTYTVSPNPGALVNTWTSGNTVLTITHANFATSWLYVVQVTVGQDMTGNDLVGGAVPNPWSFRTYDVTPPTITSTTPSIGSTGVGLGQPVVIQFSETMNKASVEAAFTCTPNPGGWSFVWSSLDSLLTAKHYDFKQMTSYICSVLNSASDVSGNNLGAGAVPNPWSFTTGTSGSSGSNPGISPDGANSNKSAVTKPMDLRNLDMATLEFWHKYNIVPGANGGVLMVGYKESAAGAYKWKYVVPSSAYTGNLRLNVTSRVDSFGTFIQWGWNGISGRGTFAWEKVNLDLLNYVPDTTAAGYNYRTNVKVKFQYYQYGGGTGYGWYMDDVRVTVSRPNIAPTNTSQDLWFLSTIQAHSGTHSWSNRDPVTGLMMPGIDNYLMSSPIDLTNARIAYLSAYVKFNLNYASGAPPDGFRVEITRDNGVTWEAVNLGVRSAWNVSGTGGDADDGYPADGKSYTGMCDSGNPFADGYWVSLGSLTRINIDLTGFSGSAIHIRFRVINNSDPAYEHSNNYNQGDPGFGGFYLDDVMVMGETILG